MYIQWKQWMNVGCVQRVIKSIGLTGPCQTQYQMITYICVTHFDQKYISRDYNQNHSLQDSLLGVGGGGGGGLLLGLVFKDLNYIHVIFLKWYKDLLKIFYT